METVAVNVVMEPKESNNVEYMIREPPMKRQESGRQHKLLKEGFYVGERKTFILKYDIGVKDSNGKSVTE